MQSVDLSAEDLQQALRHLLSRRSPGATAWHCRLNEAASKAVELAEASRPTAAAALKEAADAVVLVQRFSVQVQFPFCSMSTFLLLMKASLCKRVCLLLRTQISSATAVTLPCGSQTWVMAACW